MPKQKLKFFVVSYSLSLIKKLSLRYRKFIQSPVGVLCIIIILLFGYFKRIHPKFFNPQASTQLESIAPVVPGAIPNRGGLASLQLPSLAGSPLANAASAVGSALLNGGCNFYPEIEEWDRGISSENYLKYYNNSQAPVHPNFVVFVSQQRTASKTFDALWTNLGKLNNFETHFNIEMWNANKTLDHKEAMIKYLKEKEATCPMEGKKILYSDRNVWVNFTNFK